MLPERITAACIQMNSGADRSRNLEAASALIAEAARAGAGLVLLPENFAFMGRNEAEKRQQAEDESDSPTLHFLSKQAARHRLLLIGGSIALRTATTPGIRNTCPVFAPDGKRMGSYDKIHLFDAALADEPYAESAIATAGTAPETIDAGPWRLGLSICYDLRFPELYRHYSTNGCNLLSVPAAFTVPTGEAHWEVLLRARAIENQAFLLAAGQTGRHDDGRATWGHSMIIDPWGRVLGLRESGVGIVMAELGLDSLNRVRHTLPTLMHRRLNA